MHNSDYWESEGSDKRFTHPLSLGWLSDLRKDSRILDLGCGYGRVTDYLFRSGYRNVIGFDTSKAMVNRAQSEHPEGTYISEKSNLEGELFDLVCCIALFTSCPETDEQADLKHLIEGKTPVGALLYISDYETDDNPHYRNRYEQRLMGLYGCFESNGVAFRHHERGYFDELFTSWNKINEQTLEGKTLNGNDVVIHQYLFKKRS